MINKDGTSLREDRKFRKQIIISDGALSRPPKPDNFLSLLHGITHGHWNGYKLFFENLGDSVESSVVVEVSL